MSNKTCLLSQKKRGLFRRYHHRQDHTYKSYAELSKKARKKSGALKDCR